MTKNSHNIVVIIPQSHVIYLYIVYIISPNTYCLIYTKLETKIIPTIVISKIDLSVWSKNLSVCNKISLCV